RVPNGSGGDPVARPATLDHEKGNLMSDQMIQTITIATIAVCFGLLVLSLARRGMLSFRYTIGWLALLSIAVLAGLLTFVVSPVARWIGTSEGVIVSAAAVLVLLLICIQLSISVSGLQKQIRSLAEHIAILESDETSA
ncbi:MAG: DUF2304 domain-containing protein, partial [Ilumatobacteraceae bacterium]